MDKFALYKRKVAQRNKQKRYEQLSCVIPPKSSNHLDFTTTDFLQLSHHDHIKKGTIRSVLQFGAGSSSTRLISDHLEAHRTIEDRLATLSEKESAHLFTNHTQLHSSLLPALAPKGAIIYADQGISHTMKQAVALCKAEVKWFAHNQKHDLLSKIQDTPNRSGFQKLIVTESLFSMTGEEAFLFDLGVIAKNTGCILYVDDSASFGMYGKNSLGHSSGLKAVDIAIGTFGRAGGSFGSFATMPSVIKEYLATCCLSIAQAPPLAPAVIGAISAALDVIPEMDEERSHILSLARLFRNELRTKGVLLTQAQSHILTLPLKVSELKKAVSLFEAHNVYVHPIAPPLVTSGQERLRFLINASHTTHDIYKALAIIDDLELTAHVPTYAHAYLP